MALTQTINMAAFALQFYAVYGRHLARKAYPENALFGVVTEKNRAGWKVPLHDIDAVWDLVWKTANMAGPTGIHYRVAPLKYREYTYKEAGTTADMLELPALVMDFDTADGYHAPFPKGSPFEGYRLPTKREVHDMIEDVMPDSFRVDTGGGYQSIFALDRPINATDPDVKALLERVQARWAAEARARGFGLDLSVGIKAAQTQRLAGSTNWKRNDPRPVTVVKEWDPALYSLEALMLELPAPPKPERPRRRTAAKPATRRRNKDAAAFAAAVPVSYMMQDVWDMEERVAADPDTGTYGRWTFPREDGSYGQDTHASVTVNDKGTEIAFAHGNRLQGAWGVSDASTPVSSWDLLLIATGQRRMMAEVIAAAYKEPSEELAELLRNLPGEGPEDREGP